MLPRCVPLQGRTASVLLETPLSATMFTGYTRQYLPVLVNAPGLQDRRYCRGNTLANGTANAAVLRLCIYVAAGADARIDPSQIQYAAMQQKEIYPRAGKSSGFYRIFLFFCCLPSCNKYGFLVKF